MSAEGVIQATTAPFHRGQETLTIREFELYREAQTQLDTEREKRASQTVISVERLIEVKLAAADSKNDARFTAGDKALALATMDTKTHLEALNGEQSRLAKDRDRFISRDYYDGVQKEFSQWRDQVNASLSIGKGRDKGIGLSWGVVIGLIGAVVSIASILLVLLRNSP